jgi:hypothetical protein
LGDFESSFNVELLLFEKFETCGKLKIMSDHEGAAQHSLDALPRTVTHPTPSPNRKRVEDLLVVLQGRLSVHIS